MYVMFDMEKLQLTFHRVAYDHHAAAAAIRRAGLPHFLQTDWNQDDEATGAWRATGWFYDRCVHPFRAAWRIFTACTTPRVHAIHGFPMAMKIPRMTAGDGAENIVSFEVEHQIMQVLPGRMCHALWLPVT